MYAPNTIHFSKIFIVLTFVAMGVSACVPQDQLVITKENIVDAKDDLAEGIGSRVDATVDAITETVNAVKEDITGENTDNTLAADETASPASDETIIIAGVEEDTPPPSLNPDEFLGQGRTEVIAILGREDYRRVDQGVEVLQFRMASCIIDLVMSSNNDVASYHARHRVSGEDYNEITCHQDLATRRDIQN